MISNALWYTYKNGAERFVQLLSINIFIATIRFENVFTIYLCTRHPAMCRKCVEYLCLVCRNVLFEQKKKVHRYKTNSSLLNRFVESIRRKRAR